MSCTTWGWRWVAVQATALGLFVHQMAGIRPDVARQVDGLVP